MYFSYIFIYLYYYTIKYEKKMKIEKSIITEYYNLKITIESQDGRTHSMMDSSLFNGVSEQVQETLRNNVEEIEAVTYNKVRST